MAGSSGLASPKTSFAEGNDQNCNIFEHGVSRLRDCLSDGAYQHQFVGLDGSFEKNGWNFCTARCFWI